MGFLSILEGEFEVIRIDTQRPSRLSPVEVEAAHRFILMTKPDECTFNFASYGSVLAWSGRKKNHVSMMCDLQMILDRILVPLGYSLTGDIFVYDEDSYNVSRIYVEDYKVCSLSSHTPVDLCMIP